MPTGAKRRTPAREGAPASLAHRLPNPPTTFVGREPELAFVREATARGRVVLVSGPGGIGKTALVRQVLFSMGRDAVERAIALSVGPSDASAEELVIELLGALARATGRRAPRGILSSESELFATCVDLADRAGALVVIDDAHHTTAPLFAELLSSVAGYARSSRFLVTSRSELIVDGAEGQTITVGPMSDGELAMLAQVWSRGLSERAARAAAADAEGSPFWLRQRLAAGRGASASLRRTILDGLDPAATAWTRSLAWIEAPVPVRALDDFAPGRPPLASIAGALERRGLLERTSDGVRLAAVARSVLREGDALDDERALLAAALMRSAAPAATVEALRLQLALGLGREAETVTDERLGLVLAAGLAPRLWQVLERTSRPRFARIKLRTAVELGGGRALAWALGSEMPSEPVDRLAWIRVRGYAGRLAEASREADALVEALAGVGDEVAFEAWYFSIRCLVTLGLSGPALARCARDDLATTDDRCALIDGWRARALVLAGADRAALELVERLETNIAVCADAVRQDVQIQRAIVLLELGRVAAAHAAFDEVASGYDQSSELRGAQRRLVRETTIAVEMGNLSAAERTVATLDAAAVDSAELSLLLARIRLRIAVARGDGPRAAAALRDLDRNAGVLDSAYWQAWIPGAKYAWALLVAEPADAGSPADAPLVPLARALAALHEVVSTGRTTKLDDTLPTERIDAAVVSRMAASRAALLANEPALARDEAFAAISLAEAHGLALWGAEARLALADALLVMGPSSVSEVADWLGAFAERSGSLRFANEAAFYRACSREPELGPFDSLARSEAGAVAATRRSRALLGFGSKLDRVDRAVTDQLAGRIGMQHVREGASYRAGLLLDTRRGRARLPDGAEIDLGGKPLSMRLLLTLFERGGAASKADLVKAAWSLADYHPFRDDKRLQVAMGRLRSVLRDDQAEPRLIVTTADGYRFASALPVHRI